MLHRFNPLAADENGGGGRAFGPLVGLYVA